MKHKFLFIGLGMREVEFIDCLPPEAVELDRDVWYKVDVTMKGILGCLTGTVYTKEQNLSAAWREWIK